MHFDEGEAVLLKQWIIKKLEDISDADSEVLADYVLALIRNDDSEAVARTNCVDNLRDFLPDNVESFVNDVFAAIATKAYDPSRPPPPKPVTTSYEASKRSSHERPRRPNESRKRSYHDWDGREQQNGWAQSYEGGDRPMKQPRRGGRGGFDQRGGRFMQASTRPYGAPAQPYQPQHIPQMPAPPPGMPPFDPNNPLAALLAMQQAMGLMPSLPSVGLHSAANGFDHSRAGQRCKDYDLKGFCAKGASCPYEHGETPYVVPQVHEEYDPNNATMFNVTPSRTGRIDASPNGRGAARGATRGRGRGTGGLRGGGQRAPFSHMGPNHNRAITSIVVEQIPEEHFEEQAVRDFFGEFGTIEEVTMQPYKRLAIVKYDSYDAARSAYDSPKVVFDNRFVKIYWYKPETLPRPANGHDASLGARGHLHDVDMQEPEPEVDSDEIFRRQEEAQRKHEKAKMQHEEAERHRKQLDERLRTMEEERKKMAALLAKKTGKPVEEQAQESEQTKLLKAQLAKLEEEAKSLGIDPESAMDSSNGAPPYRGRGGYRGRSRGRGYYPSYRGGWAGAGSRGGAVMRLDNRPKTICVAFETGQYDNHDEALRQFLMLKSMDTATLLKHPDRGDAALVSFPQRYEGENFMAAVVGSEIPHVGKVELSWHTQSDMGVVATNGNRATDAEIKMEITTSSSDARQDDRPLRDMDTYDEADDYDEFVG